jgi:hypothetical protein
MPKVERHRSNARDPPEGMISSVARMEAVIQFIRYA